MWMTLRKFGLDYDDFASIIENVSIILRVLTIDIYKNSTKRPHFMFYILTIFGGSAYSYVYVFSMVWVSIYRYGRSNESDMIAFAISLTTSSINCLTKLIFMKIYTKDIKITLDHFFQCDAQVIPDTRFAKNLRNNLKTIKRRATFVWVFLVSDGMSYVILPFIIPGRHLASDKYILYGLEPMFESPNFEIATFVNSLSVMFATFTMTSILIYNMVIVGYNESQIRALSEELRMIWDDSQHFYNNLKYKITDKINVIHLKREIMNEFTKKRLRDIIKFHIENINLLRDVDHDFRPSLALEFSIMAFAIISELLGGLDNTYLQFPFTLTQLYIHCFIGQRLMDASNDFEKSLYTCKWENFNTTNQKTVYLMLIMSQKTLTLSAGGVTKLDFNCLMNVLKSTYSIYTTLKSTLK